MATPKSSRPLQTPAGHLEEAKLHGVLGYQIAQASISTLAVFEALAGQALGLRPVEFTILMLINENPGVAPAKLAQALAVTAPNITLWIDRLAKRDLVTREKNETDKRGQHLYATAEGKKLASDAASRLVTGERAAFASLSQGEWYLLLELLHRVATMRPKAPPATKARRA